MPGCGVRAFTGSLALLLVSPACRFLSEPSASPGRFLDGLLQGRIPRYLLSRSVFNEGAGGETRRGVAPQCSRYHECVCSSVLATRVDPPGR